MRKNSYIGVTLQLEKQRITNQEIGNREECGSGLWSKDWLLVLLRNWIALFSNDNTISPSLVFNTPNMGHIYVYNWLLLFLSLLSPSPRRSYRKIHVHGYEDYVTAAFCRADLPCWRANCCHVEPFHRPWPTTTKFHRILYNIYERMNSLLFYSPFHRVPLSTTRRLLPVQTPRWIGDPHSGRWDVEWRAMRRTKSGEWGCNWVNGKDKIRWKRSFFERHKVAIKKKKNKKKAEKRWKEKKAPAESCILGSQKAFFMAVVLQKRTLVQMPYFPLLPSVSTP